ncbi:MAG: GntR family transcriptional regulator / MocR family aminotransferase, partial [Solirubrobacteraceae bacterium]|nr:GntR family transcriptional regulator / MocR family aminotransferase [Solirubrobacteraceae bacterium]
MELFLDLSRDAGGPLRHRLEREIRAAIRAGRLAPGTPLPSTRALASSLGVSRGVVVETYAQLVAEGYLSARQGVATVVAARAAAGASQAVAGASAAPPAAAPRYDFRYGTPDLSAFPRAAWQAAAARSRRTLPDARLGYGDGYGAIELRTALAAYLGRARGVIAEPDRIVVSG